MERTDMMVMPDSKVDMAAKSAKELFSTSHCIATYYSHPYDELFDGWANLSNVDCNGADYLNLPCFLVTAIARNGKRNEPLIIKKYQGPAYEFIYNPKANSHDNSIAKQLYHDVICINGAFQNTGTSLMDVNLLSSEVELITLLNEKSISPSNLPAEGIYRLRKIEYNLQKENEECGKGNMKYHLRKIEVVN